MPVKKNGNGKAASEGTLKAILDEVTKVRVASEKNGERIDAGFSGTRTSLARLETRLDEIAKNTGRTQRWMETRLQALEKKLGIVPPPLPPE